MINERIKMLRERVLDAVPALDIENAVLLTKGFQESEGQPTCIQKAYAFRKQCQEKTVEILDGELIVGSAGSKQRAGLLSADTCWEIVDNEIDTINEREYDPFYLSGEDRKNFLEIVKPYWKGRSTLEKWHAQAPEEVNVLRDNGAIYIDRKAVRGFGETSPGYAWIIQKGMKGLREMIEERRSRLDITVPGDWEKDCYLRAQLMAAEGIATLGKRYGRRAAELAAVEKDPKRKAELEKIAEVCSWVPENPARNFWEALQSFYIYHCCVLIEQNAAAYNPGRMDQYLYPYYKQDVIEGDMTEEEAAELMACLWVKLAEPCLFQDAVSAQYSAGYSMFNHICVGGVDQDGNDAVNELSYLIIDTTMDVKMAQPSLVARYNMAKNPDKFLLKIVESIGTGSGFPAFHNDDVGIKMMLNMGVPIKDALDWNPGGCVEPNLAGRLQHCYTAFADINLATAVELAITNGVSRKTGDKISIETGDPRTFRTYEEFEQAVKDQFSYLDRVVIMGNHVLDDITIKDRIVPVLSLGFIDTIEQAKDYSNGGGKYSAGSGITLVGTADIINSLAAVKYLVYDEKLITMDRLCDALAADFKGYEDVKEMCMNAPKYGNDDPKADDIASEIFTFVVDDIEQYSNKFGRMTSGILPVSGNTPFGKEIGALPSGRNAWTPLTDGISPTGGTDVNGPTSVLKSVSHMPHARFSAGTLLNMKMEPELFATDFGKAQMMALLKGLCSLDIYHCQFNVVDEKVLRDAQVHPEDHKGLLVRVAGYTAYFTELGVDVQNEIISRTTQHVS